MLVVQHTFKCDWESAYSNYAIDVGALHMDGNGKLNET